jgi:hypothetical protein
MEKLEGLGLGCSSHGAWIREGSQPPSCHGRSSLSPTSRTHRATSTATDLAATAAPTSPPREPTTIGAHQSAHIRRGPGRHGRAARRPNSRTAPLALAGRHGHASSPSPTWTPRPAPDTRIRDGPWRHGCAAPRRTSSPGQLLHFPWYRSLLGFVHQSNRFWTKWVTFAKTPLHKQDITEIPLLGCTSPLLIIKRARGSDPNHPDRQTPASYDPNWFRV